MGLKDKLANAKTTDWLTKDISDLELKQIRDLSLISAAIELRRKDLGMNQKQFASFMDVSQAMISKWESGEYNFTINTLNEICNKLNLDFNPEPYNPYQARNQFKIINIHTSSSNGKIKNIPTDLFDSYPKRTEKVWTIA
ncbi:MAG: helix-turn-helix transcriptional regulator [Lachnospiraceae bacterium]|nr:helix-turn-helix transcriptional regulator [Lachnospiraceae bacterium]